MTTSVSTTSSPLTTVQRASVSVEGVDFAVGTVLDQLNLAEYVDRFNSQGFEMWTDVLDITETDLTMLGVKLGHRRRLQRRIASHRGVPEAHEIVYTSKDSHKKRKRDDGQRKRRYRRHPKPDPNAPRPPLTAYAQFANDRRHDLRDHALTFAQLAIEIGKQWRNIDEETQSFYTKQAAQAKIDFRNNMTDYLKSDQHKEYQAYLHSWKANERARAKESGDCGDFEVSGLTDEENETEPLADGAGDAAQYQEQQGMSNDADDQSDETSTDRAQSTYSIRSNLWTASTSATDTDFEFSTSSMMQPSITAPFNSSRLQKG